MPRTMLGSDGYNAADYKRLVRYLLADADMREVAAALGCSLKTAYSRKNNPDTFSVGELRRLCKSVRMTADDKDKLRKLIVP